MLTVEDQGPVRSVMDSTLPEAGYTVAAAEDGSAALVAVREQKRVHFVAALADAPAIREVLSRTGSPVS